MNEDIVISRGQVSSVDSLHFVPPPMESRWVRLREVTPPDYPFLYELAVSPSTGYRWRFRAAQPSYEEFVRTKSAGVFLQFLIVSAEDERRLGLVVCYQADLRNRTGYIALQGSPETMGRGWILDAGGLFINYLFSSYDFHKLYAESPSFVVDSFRTGIGYHFVEEACFREHERFMGKAWDTYIFAYYRSTWEKNVIEGTWPVGVRMASNAGSSSRDILPLGEFTRYVEAELALEHGSLHPSTAFREDLEFDSIQMLELLCAIEDLGIVLSDEALIGINTLGDAFTYYRQALAS